MIRKNINTNGSEFFTGVMMNNGNEAILCGNSVKLFNCNTQKNYQTISRMNNAIILISRVILRTTYVAGAEKSA